MIIKKLALSWDTVVSLKWTQKIGNYYSKTQNLGRLHTQKIIHSYWKGNKQQIMETNPLRF